MSTNRIIPISLRKNYNLIRNNISQVLIIDTADNLVANEMNLDTLLGLISSSLLGRDEINDINDGSYGFKKNLLMYINDTIEDEYEFETKTINFFNKDGGIDTKISKLIINQKDAVVYSKEWFKEVDAPIPHLILKGSNKKVDNNSSKYLDTLASRNLRVKTIDESLIDLYSVLLYEKNKNKVSESKSEYKSRLDAVAEETKLYMGHVFKNTKKLDSSTRGYHLSRFGFAYPFGDSFEKNLIECESDYIVTQKGVKEAKAYLLSEYGVKSWRKLFEKAMEAVATNIKLLELYNENKIVEFTIDGKELGKYIHIIEVVNQVIYNVGNPSSCLISVDFTSSGMIMFSNLFGDKKMMTVANLLGGKKYDTHQMVADNLGIERDLAKEVMQPYNHGARLTDEHRSMIEEIFGERYSYINGLAEYGRKMAYAGIKSVKIVAPDGIHGLWTPYVKNCKVFMEDENRTMVHAVMPFEDGVEGKVKGYGFGVVWAHMSDGYVERYIVTQMYERYGIEIKTILDAFYIPAGVSNNIKLLAFEALDNLDGWFIEQIKEVEKQTGVKPDMKFEPREMSIVRSHNIF